jgi:hypothetical protein
MLQPARAIDEFALQGDVHQVAGEHQVVGRCRLDVFQQCRGYGRIMYAAAAENPRVVADQPLGGQVDRVDGRQRTNVHVGNMSQAYHADASAGEAASSCRW